MPYCSKDMMMYYNNLVTSVQKKKKKHIENDNHNIPSGTSKQPHTHTGNDWVTLDSVH